MSHARLLVAPLILALASPTFAQLTEKQALAQMKSDLKDARKEFKLAIGGTVQIFEGQMDQEDEKLESGASESEEFVQDVAAHAQELQKDVRTAIQSAAVRAGDAARAALEGLAAGEDLSLGYPTPFTNSSGSNLDKYEADIRKDVAKTYLALNKRLQKSAKSAEKQGVGFTWRLTPPVEFFAYESNPEGGSYDFSTPLRIDATFAAGELDQDDDTFLVVSGIGNGSAGNLTVALFGSGLTNGISSGLPIDEDTDRWSTTYASTPEGNYTIVVNQEEGGSFTGVSVGLR